MDPIARLIYVCILWQMVGAVIWYSAAFICVHDGGKWTLQSPQTSDLNDQNLFVGESYGWAEIPWWSRPIHASEKAGSGPSRMNKQGNMNQPSDLRCFGGGSAAEVNSGGI